MTTNDFICENFEVFTAIADDIDLEITETQVVPINLVNTLSVKYIKKYPQHPKAMIINTVIRAANEHNANIYQDNARCAVMDATNVLVM